MSKKNDKDGRRNNRPPQKNQFQPGQSGNPKGRPKESDDMKRISMDNLRKFIMNDVWKEVEIVENGRKKKVPKLYVMVSQLNNSAIKGNVQATRLAFKNLETAATENDAVLYEWTIGWMDLKNRVLAASKNPGSLNHYNVMYDYYMFKRDIRSVEGEDRWPYENEEPVTDAQWHFFMKIHDGLKRDPQSRGPWPIEYPE